MRFPVRIVEEIDAAVEKGACRLDERRPNWYKQIDLTTLDMGDGCLCICGQLYGIYGPRAVARIVGGWVSRVLGTSRWTDAAGRYGFVISDETLTWCEGANFNRRYEAVYNRMERAWKEQIKARLGA